MKRLIKTVTRKVGIEITRYKPRLAGYNQKVVSLKPTGPSIGNALVSHRIIGFFLQQKGQPMPNDHITAWETMQMANLLLELGYSVDAIYYENSDFIPKKDYSIFIDVLWNLERLAPLLNRDCIKIFHALWPHWLFYNDAEFRRLSALQQRKGMTLKPRRHLPWNLAMEYADYATIIGNGFTADTYRYAKKPLFLIPNATTTLYPWPEEKNYKTCRKHFLWLGGAGAVLKGLDLVLEAFSELPDYHVTVCGLKGEKDFEKVYYKELHQTSNIHALEWIDTGSPQFTELANKCIGLIYPSAGEGQSGAVLTCMHAGLIPIVSQESGVDMDDFGVMLKDCSREEIKRSIRMISDLPFAELKRMSRSAWECAREKYTKEKYTEEYRKALTQIIDLHRQRKRDVLSPAVNVGIAL